MRIMMTSHTFKNTKLSSAWWMVMVGIILAGCNPSHEEATPPKVSSTPYRTLTIAPQSIASINDYDGTVEAVRQTEIAAQVLGEITELAVSVGDTVKKNQLLLRLDAQSANQTVAASSSQLAAARAQLNLAQQEYDRQKQLFAKNYISQGALENAAAVFESAKAQVQAQIAQTGVARAQTEFHRVTAPYDAVISAVPATLGDMATPGKVLVKLYDPSQLRVVVAVPQGVATAMERESARSATVTINNGNKFEVTNLLIFPAADEATHTRLVRLDLPKDATHIAPGMHVTVSFPINKTVSDIKRISIPISALVKHAEMTGVYVISKNGEPLLRQLRLGETHGNQVEVLSGLSVGEKVAIDPQTVMGTL